MGAPTYLDFHLLVTPTGGGYRAYVVGSPAGDASATFTQPVSTEELDDFAHTLGVGRRRGQGEQEAAGRREAAKVLGGRLYAGVFTGELGRCLRSSIDEARQQKKGLRIRLNLTEAPELADLPWEYLYDASVDRFIGLSTGTPIVRYLALPERAEPLTVELPLRVLVVISGPEGYPALDAAHEWTRISDALADLRRDGRITLERMEEATVGALQQRLRQGEYHILHFIGHGGFEIETQEGVLVFEDESGGAARVSGEDLGGLLRDHAAMRLVLLNSCEGARSSRADPFSGVAQQLVRQGVPSVVAMQSEITDRAAIEFAHEFYKAVSDDYPVDAAVAEGRKAIATSGPDPEWGVPVLHLRAPDGQIFKVAQPEAAQPEPSGFVAALTATLRGVPRLAWLSAAVEVFTYLFFVLFYFPGRGPETFRQVVTDYRWQVAAAFELCAIAAAALIVPAVGRSGEGSPRWPVRVAGALLLLAVPFGLLLAVKPRALPAVRVDAFYLDYDRVNRAEDFDEARLRAMLADAGRLINVTFNWVDWRDWRAAGLRRAPIDRLSGLAALYARRSGAPVSSLLPVGITSTPLDGNEFWIGAPGVNLRVISAAGWTAMFAPPSVEEYLLHAIVLVTLEYRLNNAGTPLPPHSADEFQKFYFDGVRDKVQMRELICAGRFKPEDEIIIRRSLGGPALEAYRQALAFDWLRQTTCPRRRPP